MQQALQIALNTERRFQLAKTRDMRTACEKLNARIDSLKKNQLDRMRVAVKKTNFLHPRVCHQIPCCALFKFLVDGLLPLSPVWVFPIYIKRLDLWRPW